MRPRFLLIAGLLLIALTVQLPAQDSAKDSAPFVLKLVNKERKTVTEGGRNVSKWFVSFTVTPIPENIKNDEEYWAYIYEDKDKTKEVEQPALVKKIKLSKPGTKQQELSVILALDTSGSMTELTKSKSTRMAQAQAATEVFFTKIPPPPKAEAGLILFNHEIYKKLDLTSKREDLINEIKRAEAKGGTAYLDACLEAINMLKDAKERNKVLVLMTDGQDVNSENRNLNVIVDAAKAAGVKIYPIGIGEPGIPEPITTVLTLDISGSMNSPANAADKVSKLKALITAANRYIKLMPDSTYAEIRSSVLLFSDSIKYPNQNQGSYGFTKVKKDLFEVIGKLLPPEEKKMGGEFSSRIEAKGETAVFDATYDAIALLDTENPKGKKAVITMTDGIDNSSRRRVDEVIARAKAANVALYMLGFGQPGEIDDKVMKQMAEETGGLYFEANNEKDLVNIFEFIVSKIHDVGINEPELEYLAKQTGGKYFQAKDVDKLEEIIVTELIKNLEVETIYTEFDSRFQDSLVDREITLTPITKSGAGTITNIGPSQTAKFQGRGLILAQMSPLVYLILLAGLGALLALPAGFKKMLGGAKK